MPCDTRYLTSKLDLAGMDRAMLQGALEADGWTVTIMRQGESARGHARTVTLASDLMVARKGSTTLNVRESGARVRIENGSEADVERVQGEIRQAYGTRAAQVSLNRFGFKQIGTSTKQADGAVKLTFRR